MIHRDPERAAEKEYDLIVVGGGIYGIALAFESARRGLRPLLLERGDFGQATTWNSLRIVHGGLRALQTFDLRRFRDGVAERRWFLRHFPDLVEPLPCLMPLYGHGLERPSVLRAALWVNDLLSIGRNSGVAAERRLGRGRVMDARQTTELFPTVRQAGLRGAALWHDAVMPRPQRVVMELLRWAASCGATALNYLDVEELELVNGRVAGVSAVDLVAGRTMSFRAPTVVNSAGPWSRRLARRWHRDEPSLFRDSLAFNVLLDRAHPADSALAVSARPGGQILFLHPWRGRCLAGTYHAPVEAGHRPEGVDDSLLEVFLAELDQALPAMRIDRGAVLRVLWGLLPTVQEGSRRLAVREVLVDHAERGGPVGLFSVSGVKFTTARRVAERALARIPRLRGRLKPPNRASPRPSPAPVPSLAELVDPLRERRREAARRLRTLIREEAVVYADDLLYRRTDWGLAPDAADKASALIRPLGEWPRGDPGGRPTAG